jgi:hypothetical protein
MSTVHILKGDYIIMNALLGFLFGCSHRTTSFPLTTPRITTPRTLGKNVGHSETYVVCLDCGTRLLYDWQQMRIGKALSTTLDDDTTFNEAPTGCVISASASVQGSRSQI